MPSSVVLLAILVLLVSCEQKAKVGASQNQHVDSLVIDGKKGLVEAAPLLTNKIAAYFSSTTEKDTFLLEARGETIVDSNLRFRIISNDGRIIYDTSFGMRAISGGEYEGDTTFVESQAVEVFQSFFDEIHFRKPAIGNDWEYDSIYSTIQRKDWDSIKSDSLSVGFSFNLGYDAVYHITYSNEKRQVVLYNICC